MEPRHTAVTRRARRRTAPPTRDPVCGMEVDPAGPPGGTVERGRYRYHFCSAGCRSPVRGGAGAVLRPTTRSATWR